MSLCKKCKKEFTPQKGLINYCSLKCRNSRQWNDDDKIKKSLSAKNSEKVKIANSSKIKIGNFKKPKEKKIWNFTKYKKAVEKNKITLNNKLLNEDFNNLSFERLRKRVILEQDGKCNFCKIDTWNNLPITLELEHIDGNRFNNERCNLEGLCPNCHSQTKTWRGRNKSNKKEKISDEDIIKVYFKHQNVRQTLLEIGLTPKGGNYKKVYNILRKGNIPINGHVGVMVGALNHGA